MKKIAIIRLAVAAVLFAGWIGWLVYLAATASRPVVLSRPQVLAADVVVIAEVEDPKKPVVVKEVRTPKAPLMKDEKLSVAGLDESDWKGPGLYILPLSGVAGQPGRYAVAPIPPSPGYDKSGPPRVYPATEETLTQLRQIRDE